MPEPEYLAGLAELIDRYGLSRKTLKTHRDNGRFPEPIARLRATPIWDVRETDHWFAHGRRPPGRPVGS